MPDVRFAFAFQINPTRQIMTNPPLANGFVRIMVSLNGQTTISSKTGIIMFVLGSKLKSLVGSILHVARQLHTNERIQNRQQVHRDVDNSNDDDYENAPGIATGSHPRSTSNDNAAKLAYEKTAECLML
jgi:hypothetical protein